MGFFSRKTAEPTPEPPSIEKSSQQTTPNSTSPAHTPAGVSAASLASINEDNDPSRNGTKAQEQKVTALAIILGAVASIGGFMFGYESGQISGFLLESDFLNRFGEGELGHKSFSAVRQGTIVGILCIGTLIGCLASGYICDKIGRRYTISSSAFFYIIGVIVEITSDTEWVQFAMGRFIGGMGIGALSSSVPMYQSESVPKSIRGVMVSSYQLMITLGIWAAYMVNFGTSTLANSAQWRIPNGLSALWAVTLGTAILFLPESPRFAYRVGRVEEARKNMARLHGCDPYSDFIDAELREIEEKLQAERVGGDHPWYEVFTGPRMLYRTLLGICLQAGQQLTGANFFFYYGTTIFASTGISNSYVTSIILGSVNVGATIFGLWIVKNCGRRISLMVGAAWMATCLMIYSFVGSYLINPENPSENPTAGTVLIAFSCFFIVGFATTWGPLVWAIVGELYPARYRAVAMALATASNWLFNFLISFFTTFITGDIHYWYGLVFAGSLFVLFWIVYFFVIESKDRSLEEIDTMYLLRVNPIKSAKWTPQDLGNEGVIGTDELFLRSGGKDIKKSENAGVGLMVHDERIFPENPAPTR